MKKLLFYSFEVLNTRKRGCNGYANLFFVLKGYFCYSFKGFHPCAFNSSSLPSRVTSAQPSSDLVM